MPYIIVKRRKHQTTPQYYGQSGRAHRWFGDIRRAVRYPTVPEAHVQMMRFWDDRFITVEEINEHGALVTRADSELSER